jgi:hypothetical protein
MSRQLEPMPDPISALAITLAPVLFGTRQATPLGRLRPLLVGKPHLKRRMGRWDGDGMVRSAARHLTRF